MAMLAPTLQDVLDARRTIAPYLTPTPLHRYAALDELTGAQVYVKHENHQPIGAFKVRGGINIMAKLPEEDRRRGVISASTGNHGQSIAYAGRLFGVPVTIVVPEGANPGKVASMRSLGAEVVVHGRDFDEGCEHVERLVKEEGYRLVHAANEPLLIAGVGTLALEILEAQPDVEAIVVPVGGGSGASGCCIVAKAVNSRIEVIGAQAEAAPAAYRSWKEGSPVAAASETVAEGLATSMGYELPQRILGEHLDDFILVSDVEMRGAMRVYLEHVRTLAEAAGAASLAAVLKAKERFRGRKVAVVLTGGNVSLDQLRELLTL